MPRKDHDLKYWSTPKGKYCRHKANAKKRGVEWQFTFETWWAFWESSGKWPYRGNRKGKYQMARNGDRGPYSPSNCRIVKQESNTAERNRNWRREKETPLPFPDVPF